MPTIFINHFRGFNNTFIELKDINFFIGENSTGKTSILKLVKLLSDPRFWFNFDFNIDDAELGYFSEIACAQNKENFFEIGMLGDQRDKRKKISAIKLKFINNEGQVKMSNLRFIQGKFDVEITCIKNKYQYRYIPIDLSNVDDKNKQKYFKHWIRSNSISKIDLKDVKIKENLPENFLFFNILSFIESAEKNVNLGFYLPSFLSAVTCIAPIRTEPRRTYDSYKIKFSSDGSHIPYILKQLLSNNKSKDKISLILEKFGKDSGLWEKIKINSLGTDSTSPFELLIYIKETAFKINNVGYGVSQILPLVVEILAQHNNNWFALQQPEIHLHPRGQAAFGEFVFKTYEMESKKFVIETHSDFLIDRFRFRMSKSKIKNKNYAQVLYFESKGRMNHVTSIPISDDGRYSEEQPKSFKDFFIKEQLTLLSL